MQARPWVMACAVMMATASAIHANIIFSQDFSSYPNGPVSQYIQSNPSAGQWNAIAATGSGMSAGIINGALTFSRNTAGGGGFARTTDFSPAPESMIFRFDFDLSSYASSKTKAAVWQVGSGFNTSLASEDSSLVHSQFGMNFSRGANAYTFYDVKSGAESSIFGGKSPITWVINNSSGPLSYRAPDGTTQSVSADCADLWWGNSVVFSDLAAANGSKSLTDLKFAFNGGTGSLSMDNFSIEDLQAVPEPAETGLVAGLILLAGAALHKCGCGRKTAA